MQNSYFIKIVATYSVIILIVLLWSGSNREKSIYDKYLISLDGIEVAANDLGEIKSFLTEELEFDLYSETETSLSVKLPDKRFIKVLLSDTEVRPSTPKLRIHVRVKNGLVKLHKKLNQRLGETFVSEIRHNNKKSEFTVIKQVQFDIVFFQKDFFAQ